jgi:hypothetical protein
MNVQPNRSAPPDTAAAPEENRKRRANMNYRYSGHGTFACRYTWLPKAVRHLWDTPTLFEDDDKAMVSLGVGKNMVRSMRFWAEVSGVAEPVSSRGAEMKVTDFGRAILAPDKGYDEFFEDDQTLWLVHWNLSTQAEPLFAWHSIINYWNKSDFTRTEALAFFEKEAQREQRQLSPVTLQEHLSIFLHTYVSAKSAKREMVEESLDCPLIELEFIQEVGERPMSESGRREKIYAFRTGEKPEITAELFVYCLHDFWTRWHPQEKTLSFGQIAVGECSPGQVFKMPEQEIRERLDLIGRDSQGLYDYQESTAMQQVVRKGIPSKDSLLRKIYRQK